MNFKISAVRYDSKTKCDIKDSRTPILFEKTSGKITKDFCGGVKCLEGRENLEDASAVVARSARMRVRAGPAQRRAAARYPRGRRC